MSYVTLTPVDAACVSTTRSSVTLEARLKAALEHARRLTEMPATRSIDVAIAWETVEELQTAKARRDNALLSAFDQYCATHPSAPECRIYES